MRLARDCGDISSLFPEGITTLLDLPFTHHAAIVNALGYLSFEELPDDERPPRGIWEDGDKMERWWGEVKRVREARMKGEDASMAETDHSVLDRLIVGL